MSMLVASAVRPMGGAASAASDAGVAVADPAVAALDGLLMLTMPGPDRRPLLIEDGFVRLGAAADALSHAAETSIAAVAAISARGDRIDRIQAENRSRLRVLVDGPAG